MSATKRAMNSSGASSVASASSGTANASPLAVPTTSGTAAAQAAGAAAATQGGSSRQSQRFGPYLVGETIGRGTFAKVKIAVHEPTKVRVALKIIPRKMMDQDAHSALKIRREIKIMQVLHHPHITRLFDVVQTRHDIVLVLEYVSGGELFDYITRKGRLDESIGRHLFQQLAAAIAYCHRYRVSHRDIKPENIMMESGSQSIKVSDFGLSSITHDGRFFETSCGTPNYASPEVVSGHLYGGPEADVWSCGVVLYAMLAGCLPFDDNDVGRLFKKIQTAEYVMPSYLSPLAQDLIRRMLVVNQLERATMEQVLQHPWLRPTLPPYLLSLHFKAVLDSMCFAKDAVLSEDMLDDEVVRVVAVRYQMSNQDVSSIVMAEEERLPSLFTVVDDNHAHHTRRYPAANYYETFSNVLDSKLWPAPLLIPAAEEALRDQLHDVYVSYQILLQRKQNKLGPAEFNKSFGESASTLLQARSVQGYGSLNANSLYQVPGTTSFTGGSLKDSMTQMTARMPRTVDRTFFTLPSQTMNPNGDDTASSHVLHTTTTHASPADGDDLWLSGYNRLAAPFLPLRSRKSHNTVLGHLFGVVELPVELLRALHITLEPISQPSPFITGNTSLTASPQQLYPRGGAPAVGRRSGGPVMVTAQASPQSQQTPPQETSALLRPLRVEGAALSATPPTQTQLLQPIKPLEGLATANSSTSTVPIHTDPTAPSPTGKDSSLMLGDSTTSLVAGFASGSRRGNPLDTLYHTDVATRFGNDFMRHGVLFSPSTPQATLEHVYAAFRAEGLLWRVIYNFYFSCVRFPNVKLQVKIYRVKTGEQLVDVKVSAQSGMEGYDAAIHLLERLRERAILQHNHALVAQQQQRTPLSSDSRQLTPIQQPQRTPPLAPQTGSPHHRASRSSMSGGMGGPLSKT